MENIMVHKNDSFIKKNYLYIAIIVGLICIFGLENKAALIVSIGIIVIAMFFSSNENRFCWSLLLVPNIRIYDKLGSMALVNILLCVPFLFYFIKKMTSYKVNNIPIVIGAFMFMIEYWHIISSNESVASLCGWVLAFLWCCYVTLDENVQFNRSDVVYALSFGIIISATIYLVNNPWFTSDIINRVVTGNRFEAYADDPNYYSLYICIALSGIVIKHNLKIYDYILMFILICIGFMTASKMCFLLMSLNILYLLFKLISGTKKFIRNIIILILCLIAVYMLRNIISQFIANLLKRAGDNNEDLNKLTTGRYGLCMEYINLLFNDIFLFMFGKGFPYNHYVKNTPINVAHNTFLDFILSWGVFGSLFLFYSIGYWFKKYKDKLKAVKYTTSSKLPFVVLMLSWNALSCFSAGMFFFVITYCLLQLEPSTMTTE